MKYFGFPKRKLWGFLLLLFGLNSCMHSPQVLDETDQKMFEHVAAAFDAFRNQSTEIWSEDYRLDEMPLLLMRRAKNRDLYGFLVNHPQPEGFEGSEKVEFAADLRLLPVYRIKPFPKENPVSQSPNFDFQVDLNGTKVFLMKYQHPSLEPYFHPFEASWPLYLAHEAFHAVQNFSPNWKKGFDSQDIKGYPLDERHLALIMLEDAALKMAVEQEIAQTDNSEYLRYFVAVREERIRLYPEVARLDFPQERFEGTARYIENRLGALLQNPDFNLESFATQLNEIGESHIRDTAAFARFYGTGAAISFLLDELKIPWKKRVEQSESPYEVLLKVLRQKQVLEPDDLAAAKEKLDFSAIQIRAKKAALQEQKEPKDIFGSEFN